MPLLKSLDKPSATALASEYSSKSPPYTSTIVCKIRVHIVDDMVNVGSDINFVFNN